MFLDVTYLVKNNVSVMLYNLHSSLNRLTCLFLTTWFLYEEVESKRLGDLLRIP